jgi:excinuclease UvrABC nuclease subunit
VAVSYVKSACRDSPEAFLIGVLTQCRGVSEALAKIILFKFPNLSELMNASSADLAQVSDENNKRKVGKAVADRLYSLLH